MRLKLEDIDKNTLFNSKGEKVEYREISPDYFIETGYRQLFMYREKIGNKSKVISLKIGL